MYHTVQCFIQFAQRHQPSQYRLCCDFDAVFCEGVAVAKADVASGEDTTVDVFLGGDQGEDCGVGGEEGAVGADYSEDEVGADDRVMVWIEAEDAGSGMGILVR